VIPITSANDLWPLRYDRSPTAISGASRRAFSAALVVPPCVLLLRRRRTSTEVVPRAPGFAWLLKARIFCTRGVPPLLLLESSLRERSVADHTWHAKSSRALRRLIEVVFGTRADWKRIGEEVLGSDFIADVMNACAKFPDQFTDKTPTRRKGQVLRFSNA